MCAKGGEPLEWGWSNENLVGQEGVPGSIPYRSLLHCFWLLTQGARHQPGRDCLTLDAWHLAVSLIQPVLPFRRLPIWHYWNKWNSIGFGFSH